MSGIYQKLKYKAGMASREALFKVGMGKGLLKNRPGGRILIYHGIDQVGDTELNSRFITTALLEEQLAFFKEHFHVISLEDYYAGERHKEKLTVCLTFDDGYANFHDLALPLLEKYKLPATIFITTIRQTNKNILWPDFLDLAQRLYGKPVTIDDEVFSLNKKGKYASEKTKIRLSEICRQSQYFYLLKMQEAFPHTIPFDKLPLNWELMNKAQIKAVSESPLITVGAHGMLHTSFSHVDRYFALEEMRESKSWLENVTGKPVNAIAFPFGDYTDETVSDALSIGYEKLLAVDFNHKKDAQIPEMRERLGINPHISRENQLHAILKGSY